jgi:SM-20-related protein
LTLTRSSEIESVVGMLVGRLVRGQFVASPWPHLYLPDALPMDYAQRIAKAFPADALQPCERNNSDKDYRLWTSDFADPMSQAGLAPNWRGLLAALSSDVYRGVLARLSGVDLSSTTVSLTCWEYRSGDFLAAHLDKPEKVLTQVIYLGEGWAQSDGGRLRIQRTRDVRATASALAPTLGASAVLVRSERSWHSVEALATAAAPRRSINLTYWKRRADG